jgi:hypothetical protein
MLHISKAKSAAFDRFDDIVEDGRHSRNYPAKKPTATFGKSLIQMGTGLDYLKSNRPLRRGPGTKFGTSKLV